MFNKLAIILLLTGCAFGQAVEETNAGTTGTTTNLLATVNASGQAVTVTTGQTNVPIWIQVGPGGTTGIALLATTGQAACTFDASNASFASSPVYVIASTTNAGDCHAQTTLPASGTYIAGFLASAATTSGQTSAVNVQLSVVGAGITGPGSTTSSNLVCWNSINGTVTSDCGIASGNVVQSSVTLTSNIVMSGAGGKNANVNSSIDWHNLVTATTAATLAGQVCVAAGASKSCNYFDFPDEQYYLMANCTGSTASTVDATFAAASKTGCLAGTNNKGAFLGGITDTSTTWVQWQHNLPLDWETTTGPFLRFDFFTGDTVNGHTVIPQIQVSCAKGDGSTTYDVAFNTAHSAGTVTLNGTANAEWNTSTVQMNATDLTGCVAGSIMTIQIGRATDTATTNMNLKGITVTMPRVLVLQAN